MEPYYQDDSCTIYHGDCREILPSMRTESIDLVLTDPPYGINYNTHNSSRINRPNDPKCRAVDFPSIYGDEVPFDPALLLTYKNLILCGANNYASRLPDSACWLAWDKKLGRASASNIGDGELAWTRGLDHCTVRVFRHMWAGYQRQSEVGHRHLHPTQKPVALFNWCLGFFPDARTILDPYMGSGPVIAAAKNLNRKAIGIEIEERYCEIAARRLQQEVLPLEMA